MNTRVQPALSSNGAYDKIHEYLRLRSSKNDPVTAVEIRHYFPQYTGTSVALGGMSRTGNWSIKFLPPLGNTKKGKRYYYEAPQGLQTVRDLVKASSAPSQAKARVIKVPAQFSVTFNDGTKLEISEEHLLELRIMGDEGFFE
jgi:hypothetical protein